MHPHTPAVAVPATPHATALLTEWLIRELTPLVLTHAGLPDPQRLYRLPPITGAHITRPGKLRRHVRALEQVLAQIEVHLRTGLRRRPPTPLTTDSAPAVPGEVLEVTGLLAGAVAELGSPAAALANRTVLTAAGVIAAGAGTAEAFDSWSTTAWSYCTVVSQVWQDEPRARMFVDPR
ncbi:hypothetical protein QM787_24940 [Rhodococcus ruber]|uniref:Uncharacterized protein n=1 Tax=Rhodococcus ruber TaxID=1830 RepID=A0A098BPA5_9NOCA|nr:MULTISPECIES: hypothetical protein [Rhodococcus]AUM19272.1 hypothetical protein CSW53_23715 [Rhodococcus ruber]AXY49751.1 hypothetical protein YT1_0294 [Rhodococcus ruber]MBD8057095.1 hypothetical protein [Rhodococcus ruber]MBP2214271.1 hypothetical protein [Rhodococcus ruber]MCD2129741.1 hypothetical protein [Rhodococcus ruber]